MVLSKAYCAVYQEGKLTPVQVLISEQKLMWSWKSDVCQLMHRIFLVSCLCSGWTRMLAAALSEVKELRELN